MAVEHVSAHERRATCLTMARAEQGAAALGWLLACLDRAVECMDACGFDIDARVVEAHRAQLVRGREWPGQPIDPATQPQ